MDWQAWHEDYADPDSALGRRLAVVQAQVRAALDRAPSGPVRAISVCSGQGHDLIGALAEHPRREDVSARLVDLDDHNVALARDAAQAAGLDRAIDLVFLDDRNDLYLPVLRLLEPHLSPSAMVVADLSAEDPDLIPYLEHVRDRTGYFSMTVPLDDGVELSTHERTDGCE